MAPAPIDLGPLGLIFAAILGALIGSFSNVVIYRLPRGESIAFPGSHCPNCNHQLSPLELIPIVSWLALRGRCRSCREAISIRYPVIEALMALGFVLIWWTWPPLGAAGLAFIPLAALVAILVILAAIDFDTFTLPDVLTLPALALALLATLLYPASSDLPTFYEAVVGAGMGAGVLVLINRIGGLILRRFRDTGERLWPIGFDQVNIAALAGAVAGWQAGVAFALVSLVLNLILRRPLRLPEPLLLSLWVVALLLATAGVTVSPLVAVGGSLVAAGTAAIAGAIYWWLAELSGQVEPDSSTYDVSGKIETAEVPAPAGQITTDDEEPVAMGFGDVKLAALMGAMLGWEKLLLAVFLSFIVGAVGGITGRLLGGDRVVPFGPYLVIGALVALFLGDAIIGWYLGMLAI